MRASASLPYKWTVCLRAPNMRMSALFACEWHIYERAQRAKDVRPNSPRRMPTDYLTIERMRHFIRAFTLEKIPWAHYYYCSWSLLWCGPLGTNTDLYGLSSFWGCAHSCCLPVQRSVPARAYASAYSTYYRVCLLLQDTLCDIPVLILCYVPYYMS